LRRESLEKPKVFIPRILHHGNCSGEFRPLYVGTDYFTFFHAPCRYKPPYYGHSRITKVLVDEAGRIIFNLECRNCGFRDALKTHPLLWIAKREGVDILKFFAFSPIYKKVCRPHWWDKE